ncbi:MAG: hypothetical protein E6R04_06340 [Spirochaetes bacterium]|nr:MAG: hypothetical protein E6R04_06340 [Spirochaetota bacterium]
MVRAAPIKTSFNAGEYSPLMEGHINLERFPDSCRLLQNLLALKQGPAVRRGGTRFVKEVKNSAHNTVLIPFEFSVDQAYQIEAGDQYFRFYTDNSIITSTAQNITGISKANPAVVTYSGSDTYANGDEVFISGVVGMTQVNGRFFRAANVNAGANTFELTDTDGNNINSTSYTTYSSGGTVAEVYQIASPYAQADLVDADGVPLYQYAQSADVLYIAHGSYAVRALSRTGNAAWSIAEMNFIDGPFLPENDTTTTLTLSSTSGSVTVTASATTGINGGDGFKTTDVGRLIRWKDPSNDWTWLKITAWTSATVVTATIRGQNASAGTATTSWRLGVYSATTGYPRVITFFQDRVLLAGADAYPDRWDLSKSSGYSNTEFQFSPTDSDGVVADDNAITGTLQSGQVNALKWAGSDDRGLILGTTSKEWIVRPSSTNEVLTPENAKADPFSSIGSVGIQPIQAESGTVFVQRARRRVHDIIYSFERDTLKPRDLTIAAEHITRSGVSEIKFQQEPINTIWARRTDGLLIGMTYYPDEAVFAAHRHPIGGDGLVKSISVIPSSDGTRDELWLIVERTINETTRKYIEYMTRYYEDDIAKEDAFHVDCGLTYDGSATVTVSGFDHLEGETLKVMVDGRSHPDLTVTDGTITLANDRTGSVISAGLGNAWAFKSQRMEAGSQDGTAQGKTKRISGFVVRLMKTLGLKYGPDENNLDEYDFNQGAGYDEDIALFDGDTEFLLWPGGYETDAGIYLTDDGVFPAAILAIMPILTTYDR